LNRPSSPVDVPCCSSLIKIVACDIVLLLSSLTIPENISACTMVGSVKKNEIQSITEKIYERRNIFITQKS